MPDELDALRHFRDETPGPSTDAWNRARAAIATAKAEEEPARRRHPWMPGRRSPGQGPRRRRVLVIAAGCAVAAAVAGLLAVLLPNSPATQGTGQIETTAFVTHVKHALSESGQRNLIGYARTVYPSNTSVQPMGPGVMRIMAGRGASSPWRVGSLVRWSYQGTMKASAVTAAGYRVFDFGTAREHGTLIGTAVLYRTRTWWRGTIGPVLGGDEPAPERCGRDIQIGSGGWPAFLSHALTCGEYAKSGQQRIRGIDAIELTAAGGGTVIWVNPRTYLPVRATLTIPGGARMRTDFGWFAPTQARLAQLRLPIPPGFRQVSAP